MNNTVLLMTTLGMVSISLATLTILLIFIEIGLRSIAKTNIWKQIVIYVVGYYILGSEQLNKFMLRFKWYNNFNSFINTRPNDKLLYTECQWYDGNTNLPYGKLDHNMTVLGGRLSILENMFKPTININQHTFIESEELNLPHVDASIPLAELSANLYNRKADVFVIGTQGISLLSTNAKYKVRNWETSLYTMVPFRAVLKGSDLQPDERAKYRLRKIGTLDGAQGSVEYIFYYGKKFNPNQVNVMRGDSIYTPDIEDTQPVEASEDNTEANAAVTCNVEFQLAVEGDEFKEWYKLKNNGSLEGASISEIGILTANDYETTGPDGETYTESKNAEMIVKLCTTKANFDTDGSARILRYVIYS